MTGSQLSALTIKIFFLGTPSASSEILQKRGVRIDSVRFEVREGLPVAPGRALNDQQVFHLAIAPAFIFAGVANLVDFQVKPWDFSLVVHQMSAETRSFLTPHRHNPPLTD